MNLSPVDVRYFIVFIIITTPVGGTQCVTTTVFVIIIIAVGGTRYISTYCFVFIISPVDGTRSVTTYYFYYQDKTDSPIHNLVYQ